MKHNSKGNFGLILIIIGIIFLLMQLDIFNFTFSLTNIFFALINLWPITFIVIGLSILFQRNTIIKIILWGCFLVIIVLYSFYGVKISPLKLYIENGHFSGIWDNGGNEDGTFKKYSIEKKVENAENGILNLDLAGCQLDLDDTSSEIALIETNMDEVAYTNEYLDNSKTAAIKVWQEKLKTIPHKMRFADVSLKDNIPWDLDISLSAANADLDLSELFLTSLKLNVKAGSTEIILGEKKGTKDIYIEGAAANIKIYVPEECGIVVIKKGSAMGLNNSIELEEKEGKLVSKGYNDAESIYNLHLDLDFGNVTITNN